MRHNDPNRWSFMSALILPLKKLRFREHYLSHNSLKNLKVSSNPVGCITDNLPWMFSNAQLKS